MLARAMCPVPPSQEVIARRMAGPLVLVLVLMVVQQLKQPRRSTLVRARASIRGEKGGLFSGIRLLVARGTQYPRIIGLPCL